MVCILFVGGIKTQQVLENNYFITSYNLFQQEVGSVPPNFPSPILEDLGDYSSKTEVSETFHVQEV